MGRCLSVVNYFVLEKEAKIAYKKSDQPEVDLDSFVNGYVQGVLNEKKVRAR